jgi:hypothetical protein
MYLPPSTPPESEPEQAEVAAEPEPEGGRDEDKDSGVEPVHVTEPAPPAHPIKKAAAKKAAAQKASQAGRSDG